MQNKWTSHWQERVSIILIPRDNNNVKRWEARRWWFGVGAGVALCAVVMVLAALSSSVYYWNAYQDTEALRAENAHYELERAELRAKVDQLAGQVEQAQRLVARLELEEGVAQPEEVTQAIGPISESLEYTQAPQVADSRFKLNTSGFAKLERKVQSIQDSAAAVEDRLQHVSTVRQQRHQFWASLPTEWPVRGWVTSGFGPRRATRVGGTKLHKGVDIAAPIGTPVIASGDGVVTFAGVKSGYGRTIEVDHGFGITTLYAHNSKLHVKVGERVTRGSKLAEVGMTGRTTGAHLHYEVVVDGAAIDPLRYLAARR